MKHPVHRWISLLLTVALLAVPCSFFILPSAAAAATMTISPNQSIQQAMDQLASQGGGTLYLNPGTYTVGYGVKVCNNCTLQGVSATNRPIVKLASGKDEPVITTATVPFTNVGVRHVIVDGGLAATEQNYPEYFHKGSDEYNQRISSGAESKAALDARIEAARINVVGIDFSDRHAGVMSSGATIENARVQNSAMGVIIGRTHQVTIKDSQVTNNGGINKYFHGLYLSIVDHVLVEGLDASNNKTGMGLKVTDFYDTNNEASIIIRNSKFNNNYDRGMTVYHMQNLVVNNNEAKDNGKSGINLINCKNGSLTNNTALNNPLVVNVSYDIWLNTTTNFTISGNVFGSKRGF
ncbi:right-handed parallel beta-helix repeat-containing protein [Paenibacillus daejeonensis]|uniref:right-handed parallel beta-helix repeat-containing protein n=1 Tax=Paenibacillus daejeonensis TaxID=135193 RepID=UPI0003606607|nr:right-handed parallel beta-helix repeat-containing protein [Paenibacillus daejeonensis]